MLWPPEGRAPEAVVHFLGGAFVGAAPQLAYRPLLEALASRNVLIVTTPFSTSFDNLRTADEIQYKFDRCMSTLQVGGRCGGGFFVWVAWGCVSGVFCAVGCPVVFTA